MNVKMTNTDNIQIDWIEHYPINPGLEEDLDKILNDMITKPLKRKLLIEIWKPDDFYEYFKNLPEAILKANGKYEPVEGIYMVVKKNVRGIAIVHNVNILSTFVHELTHVVDFDKLPDWVYNFTHKKWIRRFRKYVPYEKRAWNAQIAFQRDYSGCDTCHFEEVCEWLEQNDFCMNVGHEKKVDVW
jgi:hypothetical protein